MARHTITIPINKSSNSSTRNGDVATYWSSYKGSTDEYTYTPLARVSNKLYCLEQATGNASSRQLYRIGVGWDQSLIPANKIIVGAKLHLYTTVDHNKSMYYKFGDFAEGSDIPTYEPADGSKTGGMPLGWGVIDIWPLKGNQVIIHTNLKYTTTVSGNYEYDYADVWESYSHRNPTNKPYLELTYDDIPPEDPKSLYPSNIILNPRDVIKFSWLHDSAELQKSFSLQYSINAGSTWITVAQTTANQFYDMPASTLPTSGTVMWRVKTIDINDEESIYSTASFTLGIVPQKAPILLSPISQYIDENNPIRFEWIFSGGSEGETQSKYDLQYSTNGGTTWTTETVTSINKYYDLGSNILTSGNITWRVRTYNNWDEVSPYSENRNFTVIGSPPIPQILAITNNARPTITWQASGQHIYELEIIKNNKTIIETGSIPSPTTRSFKLEDYLEDGDYIVKLRILNEFNLYSPWAEKSFIISTIKPPAPIIDVYSHEYNVTIKTSNTSLKTLVYRDNVLLGEAIDNSFADYTGENKREYKYFVRTIGADDNFADSILKLAQCSFNVNTISLAKEPDLFVKLKYGFGNIPKKTNKNGVVGDLNYYDGRANPVAEFTEFEIKAKTVSFFLKTKEELDALNELIEKRQTLLYRDYNGDNIQGVIFTVDDEKTIFGYNIGFTITKTEV